MARLLLVPIALLVLFAALLPLMAAGLAGGQGMVAGLGDPLLRPAMRGALAAASLVAVLAVPLGLILALALWQAAGAARIAALALCVLVLLAPAPGFSSLHFLVPARPAVALAFFCAVARGGALALLILSAGLAAIPPGLPRAARAAGATPTQAWRHAVIAPLKWSFAGAWLVAFLAGLAEGPAGAILAPHLDLADAWVAPGALLLAAVSVAALGVLLRGRRQGLLF